MKTLINTIKFLILGFLGASQLLLAAPTVNPLSSRLQVVGVISGTSPEGISSDAETFTPVVLIKDSRKNKSFAVKLNSTVKTMRSVKIVAINGKKVTASYKNKKYDLDWQDKPSSSNNSYRNKRSITKSNPLSVAKRYDDLPPSENVIRKQERDEYDLPPKLEKYLRSLEEGTSEPNEKLEQQLLDEWFDVDPEIIDEDDPRNPRKFQDNPRNFDRRGKIKDLRQGRLRKKSI